MRGGGILGVIVLIWLLIGVFATYQRGYFSSSETNCATAGSIALTVIVERLCGIHGDPFDADPCIHARNAGRRSVGVDLMRAINSKIEQLVKEPHEPRSAKPISATERAERIAAGDPSVRPRRI